MSIPGCPQIDTQKSTVSFRDVLKTTFELCLKNHSKNNPSWLQYMFYKNIKRGKGKVSSSNLFWITDYFVFKEKVSTSSSCLLHASANYT